MVDGTQSLKTLLWPHPDSSPGRANAPCTEA